MPKQKPHAPTTDPRSIQTWTFTEASMGPKPTKPPSKPRVS